MNVPEGVAELCGRCLVVVDARTTIRARTRQAVTHAPDLDVLSLIKWAEDKMYGDGAEIEVNDTRHRFRPVSTYRGDLVCAYHLYQLVSLELRTGPRLC
jgi:ABC-type transport system involved in Fe-S cluster assembly fused permease/ATPase subunit